MARYAVYLEIAGDGRCMAHVLDLPGCHVRAPTRKEALHRLPNAIRACHAWMRRHGEPAPAGTAPIDIEVAAETYGAGPFDPGDMAALFPPEREPLDPITLQNGLGFLDYSRADLLALVRDLADDVLDWQPDLESHSIRQVLRHLGNAEEWYISRIVAPDSLPAAWEDDENLPIFEFLEMERRTSVVRLQELTQEERSGVFYPTTWTEHPEELWTARKVIRRFLEHEREHTAHIRDILDNLRRQLLDHLAAERAHLMAQLSGLDEQTLTEVPVVEDWTVKDLMAHIIGWDRWEVYLIGHVLTGQSPDLTAVQDMDAYNATVVAQWRHHSLDEVLAEMQAARAEWVVQLQDAPLEEVFRQRPLYDDTSSLHRICRVEWEHDAEHAAQITAWREATGLDTEKRS